ncbi:hypothetical protein NUW58_g8818 [Xylaria curta]|uniref:Uncharacterized protein n=1 Tax=Xylaria curta TaxID=42375 RepID=A0ACC1N4Z1_9PEZI|nr:hypothetical protein NUW58_g8818 [Xylaria curta]
MAPPAPTKINHNGKRLAPPSPSAGSNASPTKPRIPHPYLTQPDLIKLAQENNIAVTGYSSFGPQSFLELGNKNAANAKSLFEVDVVKSIAEKHGKTPGQVLLRWSTQRNVIVIPKSNNVDRLKQNLESVTFSLSDEEINQISALNQGLRFNEPADFGFRIFA